MLTKPIGLAGCFIGLLMLQVVERNFGMDYQNYVENARLVLFCQVVIVTDKESL
jgi:hypothetical protein